MLHYVTHLSCYCDQTSDTKQMKEETVYLGPQFEGPGHHGGDVMEPWSWGGCSHHSHTQKAEWWMLLFAILPLKLLQILQSPLGAVGKCI